MCDPVRRSARSIFFYPWVVLLCEILPLFLVALHSSVDMALAVASIVTSPECIVLYRRSVFETGYFHPRNHRYLGAILR